MESRSEEDVALIAGNILAAIQMPCHFNTTFQRISLEIKASIGIAIFPKDGITAETLIKTADAAMYQAKRYKSGFAFAQ